MSEARRQILQMLQEGKVTADQAMELLQALEPSEQIPALTGADVEDVEDIGEALTGEVIQPAEPPDMERYRRFWQIPFFIAIGAVIISGLGLRSLYRSADGAITFWFICVWSVFVMTSILTVLAFLSRRATWLHVRIKERKGRRISISLPLPLGIASWGLDIARGFVGDDVREKIDMASGFLAAARDNLRSPESDPLMINVDDDDGDQVQVFIG